MELGSYEFLLSQQFCETMIEMFIADVYEKEIEVGMRDRLMAEWRGENSMRGKSIEMI